MKKNKIIILKIKLNILTWCIEDYTDLLTISDFVNSYYLINEDTIIIKENTLKTIRKLLDDGVILAGSLQKGNTFKVWKRKTDEIIKEIEIKWDNLNRPLHPHEIVWFDITEKGSKEFEYLNNLPELKETDPFYFDDK
ncbi:MAG: hypothetical protein KR126chlam6_00654 [Candidatus Anoxychlamydiales bacterium]|nr:hypothetical protein [Candidatus Anoxychlamydiales bacterium]